MPNSVGANRQPHSSDGIGIGPVLALMRVWHGVAFRGKVKWLDTLSANILRLTIHRFWTAVNVWSFSIFTANKTVNNSRTTISKQIHRQSFNAIRRFGPFVHARHHLCVTMPNLDMTAYRTSVTVVQTRAILILWATMSMHNHYVIKLLNTVRCFIVIAAVTTRSLFFTQAHYWRSLPTRWPLARG